MGYPKWGFQQEGLPIGSLRKQSPKKGASVEESHYKRVSLGRVSTKISLYEESSRREVSVGGLSLQESQLRRCPLSRSHLRIGNPRKGRPRRVGFRREVTLRRVHLIVRCLCKRSLYKKVSLEGVSLERVNLKGVFLREISLGEASLGWISQGEVSQGGICMSISLDVSLRGGRYTSGYPCQWVFRRGIQKGPLKEVFYEIMSQGKVFLGEISKNISIRGNFRRGSPYERVSLGGGLQGSIQKEPLGKVSYERLSLEEVTLGLPKKNLRRRGLLERSL